MAKLQSIEHESNFQTGIKPYTCHIKPKAQFKTAANDENNKLAATWFFHQLFDGIMTGQSSLPLVALNPVGSATDGDIIGDPPAKRKRVDIEVEFCYAQESL